MTTRKQFKQFDLIYIRQAQQTLEGGVIIEDLTNGTGKMVKKNSTVNIEYTVSTESGNLSSKPAKAEVVLGKRQSKVFKCWSVGIPGMRAGGIRRITSPPSHAYGSNGLLPFIDGNTNVIFEVTVNTIENQ